MSVIIDTYNYASYIQKCIESVLNQTYDSNKMEIIVVDDGSTDDTRERVLKYEDKIKYFYKENGGQASALNVGFENSSGDYLVFLDSDDLMFHDRVEKVVEEFERHDEVVTVLNDRRIISTVSSHEQILPDHHIGFNNCRLDSNSVNKFIQAKYGTSRTSLRRSAVGKIFPLPEKGLEIEADLYLNIVCFFLGNLSVLPDELTYYRIHGDNSFSVTNINNISNHIYWMENAINYSRKTISGFANYDSDILNTLLKPYEVQLREKKLVYGSYLGKARRRDFIALEFDKLAMCHNYSRIYLYYKYISILFLSLFPVRLILKIKDYYYRNKLFRIRRYIFPF